uniref:Uncharacterized protein n=1 Tax=Anguilla anguilla TaxID=7936 RepID=A0A0E9XMM3_ANGAN
MRGSALTSSESTCTHKSSTRHPPEQIILSDLETRTRSHITAISHYFAAVAYDIPST